MDNEIGRRIFNEVAGAIDIPDSAYVKATNRYKSLGSWFGEPKAACQKYSPHIYLQGSFRLGTVIRPFGDKGEFDLDMGCRLRNGVTKENCSQKTLKGLVGQDVEAYRQANGIKDAREEKHRCWRLKYADELRFHLDVVPSIPADAGRVALLTEAMAQAGATKALAASVASHTGAITDNRMPNYAQISSDWHLSNSEGFALWFESRMETDVRLKGRLLAEARAAKVDKVPTYRWKSPLQRVVQILKAHRDQMFSDDPDGKPASIIITTLAALAYNGAADVADALDHILTMMPTMIRATVPRVPNPVNPAEDFADRWRTAEGQRHDLEGRFFDWMGRARADFDALGRERRTDLIVEAAKSKFGANLETKELGMRLGIYPGPNLLQAAAAPAGLSFPNKALAPQKPAGFASPRRR